MKSRRLRTALTVLGVTLGVAVIFATQITIASTLAAFDEMVNAVVGRADLLISSPSPEGISTQTASQIINLSGIKVASGTVMGTDLLRRSVPKKDLLRRTSSSRQLKPIPVTIVGLSPQIDSKLREYSFLKGAFFQGDAEVVITKELSKERGLKLGKTVQLQGSLPAATNFKIVGVLNDAGAGRITGGQTVFLSLKAARKLFAVKGYSNLDVDVSKGVSLSKIKAKIQQLDKSLIIEEPASRAEAKKRFLNLLNIGLIFFGSIALFVGAFLVLNTFNMIVKEQTRELGLLRSLGASRAQTSSYILIQGAVVGLIGAVIGLASGYFLSGSLISYFNRSLGQTDVLKQTLTVAESLRNLAFAFFVGLVATVLAVFRPAYKASTLPPLTAISGAEQLSFQAQQKQLKRSLLAVFLLFLGALALYTEILPGLFPFLAGSDLWQRQAGIFLILFGFIGLLPLGVRFLFSAINSLARKAKRPLLTLASNNLLANPVRAATTSAATMVTVTMLIIIGGLISSFQKSVNQWVESSVKADIFVATEDMSLTLPEKVEKKLAQIKAVKDLTTIRFFPVRTKAGQTLTFRAVDPVDFEKFANFQFVNGDEKLAWLRLKKGKAVFISSVTANKYKLKVGQTLKLMTKDGIKPFFIAAEVVDFAGEMDGLVVGSQADAKKFFKISRISAIRLKLKPREDIKAAVSQVKKALHGYQARVEDLASFKARVDAEVSNTFSVFNILAILAFVVAVLSIFNTLMLNIFERQKEIGVLRATGLSRWQLSQLLALEAVLMGLTGGLAGLVIGLALAKNLVVNMTKISGHSLMFVTPVNSLYLALFLTFIFSLLASFYPAYKAGRLEITKAIQYE